MDVLRLAGLEGDEWSKFLGDVHPTVLATMPGLPMFGHGQFEAAGAQVYVDREWQEDKARKQLVKFFEALGPKLYDAHMTQSELEQQVQEPDLWDDQDRAKQVNAAYARARDDVDLHRIPGIRLDDRRDRSAAEAVRALAGILVVDPGLAGDILRVRHEVRTDLRVGVLQGDAFAQHLGQACAFAGTG